jgi:hypothetical protein
MFLIRGRVLPTLREFLQRYPMIYNHFYRNGDIPGEDEDEQQVLAFFYEMTTYEAARDQGENVEKPTRKSFRQRQASQNNVLGNASLNGTHSQNQQQMNRPSQYFPANNAPGNPYLPNAYHPASRQQDFIGAGGLQDPMQASGYKNAPNLHNQWLRMQEQTPNNIITYSHPYGETINTLVARGCTMNHDLVRLVEAANGNINIAVEYLFEDLPNSQNRNDSAVQSLVGTGANLFAAAPIYQGNHQLNSSVLHHMTSFPANEAQSNPGPEPEYPANGLAAGSDYGTNLQINTQNVSISEYGSTTGSYLTSHLSLAGYPHKSLSTLVRNSTLRTNLGNNVISNHNQTHPHKLNSSTQIPPPIFGDEVLGAPPAQEETQRMISPNSGIDHTSQAARVNTDNPIAFTRDPSHLEAVQISDIFDIPYNFLGEENVQNGLMLPLTAPPAASVDHNNSYFDNIGTDDMYIDDEYLTMIAEDMRNIPQSD